MKAFSLALVSAMMFGQLALAGANNEDCAKRNQSDRGQNQQAIANQASAWAKGNGQAAVTSRQNRKVNQ